MRALSICQPFPSLILLPTTDARHKRIENRQWNYVPDWTGDFFLHASKRKDYRSNDYGIPMCDMDFGAVVGVAHLDGAFRLERRENHAGAAMPFTCATYPPDWASRRWPWADQHEHLEGPVCLVLSKIRKLPKAIPYKGRLGVFDIPAELIAGARLVDVDTEEPWFISGLSKPGTGAARPSFRQRKPGW